MDVPVLIAGGGPVGVTLAMDLAWRGIRSIVVERRLDLPPNPRCNTTNARSMEIFRRLGCADAVRAAGLPAQHSTDVVYMTAMNGHELTRFARPTPADWRAGTASGIGSDWPTPEPQHFISQLLMEPPLRAHATQAYGLDLRTGWEVVDVVQDPDGVTTTLRDERGAQERLRSRYVVGADGSASVVRRAIGARLEGVADLGRTVSVFFRSRRLAELHRRTPAWMYRFRGNVVLVAIDGVDRWLMHTQVPPGADLDSFVFEPQMFGAVGESFDYEVINVAPWTARAMVATKFVDGRVVLAGDAAHIWIPMGGFGMNAGIGDADGLGWRLAGLLQGWLEPAVLDSYESERASLGATVAAQAPRWSSDLRPLLYADEETWSRVDRSDVARKEFGQRIHEVNISEWESAGLQLGFSYVDSPVVDYGGGRPSPFRIDTYVPSAHPGSRAPHVWRAPGVSLHDQFGKGFTLLRVGLRAPSGAALLAAAGVRGIPMTVIELGGDGAEPEAVATYGGTGLVLVRPDHHVAWRSADDPADPGVVLDRVTGLLVARRAVVHRQARRLGGGFLFPEGLRWRRDRLVFSDMTGCRVVEFDPATGELATVHLVEHQPNGLALLPDGRLLVASMFDAKLLVEDGAGLVEYADLSGVVTGYLGDMVVDALGRVYVDDVGARVLHGEPPRPGRVLLVDTDRTVRTVLEGIRFPNGIALTPDGATLILGETLGGRMLQCRVLPDGDLAEPRTFVDLTVDGAGFGSDGIEVTADGGAWACLPEAGTVARYDRAGRMTDRVTTPGMPIACALSGDGDTLYVVGNDPLPDGITIFEAIAGRTTRGWIAEVPLNRTENSPCPSPS